MSNLTITNVDLGSVIFKDAEFRDNTLTLAGALTVKEGTILARDSSTLKLIPFVKGGTTNGNGIPKAVLTYAVVSLGAGDTPIRAMVSGEVRFERLVIIADGNASNVDAVVLDQLRDFSITSINVQELAILDNQ
jgi:hypothetical protein